METMGAGVSIGRVDNRGILPRALKQIVDEGMGDVAISYYEILKDETCTRPKVVDLLVSGGKVLPLKLDKSQEAIQGLSKVAIRREDEALALIASGSRLRSCESTSTQLEVLQVPRHPGDPPHQVRSGEEAQPG